LISNTASRKCPFSHEYKKRLQRFLDGISERLCHDTVSGCYIYLKAVFAEAVEQRIVLENPTKTLTLPRTRERDTHTVSFGDVQRLQGPGGQRQGDFKLLSGCGPRAREAVAFQWQDLQLPEFEDSANIFSWRIEAAEDQEEPKTHLSAFVAVYRFATAEDGFRGFLADWLGFSI
jgi:hypothetical protein